MDDRKLLELAAKAVDLQWMSFGDNGAWIAGRETLWNPLEDDGDALRLAGQLCFNVNMKSEGCVVDSGDDEWIELGETLTATRRAIVRAAAEIGRAM